MCNRGHFPIGPIRIRIGMIQRYSQSKAMSGERNRKDRSEGMRRSNRHTTCAARKSRLRTCDNDAAKRMGRAVKCPPLPCSNARLGGAIRIAGMCRPRAGSAHPLYQSTSKARTLYVPRFLRRQSMQAVKTSSSEMSPASSGANNSSP